MPDTNPLEFLHPTKKCDIVMKGGITSGVVYPTSVCTLAKTYRFMNIGGTSAGAIAAAATAAAEYRRQNPATKDEQRGNGFAGLARLPEFLAAQTAGHTNLFWLFQPDLSARLLFNIGVRFTKNGASGALSALLTGAPVVWLFPSLVAIAFLLRAILGTPHAWTLSILAAFSWMVLTLVAGILLVLVRAISRLPAKGFGLCSGKTPPGAKQPALADWFHGFLNDLAGKPHETPLTFGDLHDQGIQLRMISTNVTHGRPYGLPLDTANFYFRPEELAEYFPEAIIQWMMDHPGHASEKDNVNTNGFCRLPDAADLPVVVAARMSLSFPFLFRAVPLYTVDFTLLELDKPDPMLVKEPGGALQPGEPRVPERCWFLDGGICSNFPISMFDGPLPRWPTFGIDLQPLRKDRPDSTVWMPARNEEGLGELWNRIPAVAGIGPLVAYAGGMIDAARNWMDNRQMTVPGYRDRIVHIRLDDNKEGGLNLDMDSKTVTILTTRGADAARLLMNHFAHPAPHVELTWDNHRWIRLRSLFGQLETLLTHMHNALQHPEPGERSYGDLLNRDHNEPPNSYRVNTAQRETINYCLRTLTDLAAHVEAQHPGAHPTYRAPRPVPSLRILPRIVPTADADHRATLPVDPPAEGIQSLAPPE
jgi:predicted acylesterase/phospholipase RssA